MGSDGVISTVAGWTSVGGYAGDGGQATSAQLYGPAGVFMDTSSSIFIADTTNSRIRKVALVNRQRCAPVVICHGWFDMLFQLTLTACGCY